MADQGKFARYSEITELKKGFNSTKVSKGKISKHFIYYLIVYICMHSANC